MLTSDKPDPREKALIEVLHQQGFHRFASIVEGEFDRGVSYSDAWQSLFDIIEIFQDVAWKHREKAE